MDTPTTFTDDDYDNDIPLQRRRAFGTGLLKKPIAFVPATGKTDTVTALSHRQWPQDDIADTYLDIVLARDISRDSTPSTVCSEDPELEQELGLLDSSRDSTPSTVCSEELDFGLPKICSICRDIISPTESSTHQRSLAHQVALRHSHVPSALDRSRMGLSYLETYGWDPDSRRGLGASYQGIPHPIKPKPKDDKLGIGITVPRNLPLSERHKNKGILLGAGKVRKLVKEEKRRAERIRKQLFGIGNQDLEKYLGPGALY